MAPALAGVPARYLLKPEDLSKEACLRAFLGFVDALWRDPDHCIQPAAYVRRRTAQACAQFTSLDSKSLRGIVRDLTMLIHFLFRTSVFCFCFSFLLGVEERAASLVTAEKERVIESPWEPRLCDVASAQSGLYAIQDHQCGRGRKGKLSLA